MTSQIPSVAAASADQMVHTFANGLTLIAERVENVRSAALTLLIPGGAASDPENALGSASVLSDWMMRGAGERDNRQLTDYLDQLGVQRSMTAETVFMRLSASLLARNFGEVLPVCADIMRQPQLPEGGFAAARDLAIQQLDAIEDEPSQKLNLILKMRHFPDPFGRPIVGQRDHLAALTAESLRADYHRRFSPVGAILAVAGALEFQPLKESVANCFGEWRTCPPPPPTLKPAPGGVYHVTQPANQVQIGLACDTVPESHPDSILMQLAVGVLSGGMGARLFSEIREKQGLCYAVHAGYISLARRAAILGYAGTTPERAATTLNSFLRELERLRQGVTPEELERAKIGMKSRVIMHGESTAARAAALAYDYYHYGRPRTLDELRQRIERVSLEQLNAFLAGTAAAPITQVTVGPAPVGGGEAPAIPHTAINDTFQWPGQRASGPEKQRDAASTLTNGTSQ